MGFIKKHKKLLIIGIVIYVAISIPVMAFYVYPNMQKLLEDPWYKNDIKQVATDFLSEIAPDEPNIVFHRYKYSYDEQFKGTDTDTSSAEYPFSAVDVTAQIGNKKYVLHIVKDADG
ncbi:MAG: hypothetical protein IJW92_00490, partial [Clostridia bacterium]|nr:hypothetical protein [Clostridia bacterium]